MSHKIMDFKNTTSYIFLLYALKFKKNVYTLLHRHRNRGGGGGVEKLKLNPFRQKKKLNRGLNFLVGFNPRFNLL